MRVLTEQTKYTPKVPPAHMYIYIYILYAYDILYVCIHIYIYNYIYIMYCCSNASAAFANHVECWDGDSTTRAAQATAPGPVPSDSILLAICHPNWLISSLHPQDNWMLWHAFTQFSPQALELGSHNWWNLYGTNLSNIGWFKWCHSKKWPNGFWK